jgi:hypothetical protein
MASLMLKKQYLDDPSSVDSDRPELSNEEVFFVLNHIA